MLEFFKKLLGLAPKTVEEAVPVAAPYKVETPAPVVEAAPAPAPTPAQVDTKTATGAAKSNTSKGAEAGAKPAKRRKKPAAT
jgi:hypothetical protein